VEGKPDPKNPHYRVGSSAIRVNYKRKLFHLGHVHLENLPKLSSIEMLAPAELTIDNVGTQIKPIVNRRKDTVSVVKCELYGLLTPDLMKSLASRTTLTNLELFPTENSDPQSIRALASHTKLEFLKIRVAEHPEAWLESIVASGDSLKYLEFLEYRSDPPGDEAKIDAEDVALLAKLKNLKSLSLRGLRDPEGKNYAWHGDMAEFEKYIEKKIAEKSRKEEDEKLRMQMGERDE
jgi:hypothetical protein